MEPHHHAQGTFERASGGRRKPQAWVELVAFPPLGAAGK